jgi:antitoxin HigA-1
MMSIKNGMRPVHPGEVLREDFLRPAGLSVNALAKALHVPTPRINDVVRERRGVTADTALRLARYFGGDAQSWLNLQAVYDLRVAEIANRKKIEREVSPIDRDLGGEKQAHRLTFDSRAFSSVQHRLPCNAGSTAGSVLSMEMPISRA